MVAELKPVAWDIPLDRIRNDLPQVRRDWRHDKGHEKLDDMAESMRQHGVRVPIEVCRRDDGTYEVLTGHRRVVAARRAGLAVIPAVAREANEEERAVLQLIENIHRQGISPADEAEAYAQLLPAFGHSGRALGRALGVQYHRIQALLHMRADRLLTDAVSNGQIAAVAAGLLCYLGDAYAAPLYERLRQGDRVTNDDVEAARAQKHRDGFYEQKDAAVAERQDRVLAMREKGLTWAAVAAEFGLPTSTVRHLAHGARKRHRDWVDPVEETATQARQRERMATAARLRAQGLSTAEILAAMPELPNAAAVRHYLRMSQRQESAAPPEPALDAPHVTFEGVNLDPIIAKAMDRQEHEDHEQKDEALPAPPHPRPTRSPLPWENEPDDARDAGVIDSRDPATQAPAATGAPQGQPATPTPLRRLPAPSRPLPRPQEPADDPLKRLRLLQAGAEKPCTDLMRAAIRIGMEHGWSCVELMRNVEAASDLVGP